MNIEPENRILSMDELAASPEYLRALDKVCIEEIQRRVVRALEHDFAQLSPDERQQYEKR